MLGIENLKKVVKLGLDLGEFIEGVLKPDMSDVGKAIEVIKEGVEAVASLPHAVPEYLDLDSSEKDELKAYVAAEFDIADDKLEGTIEMALKVVVDLSILGGFLKKSA
jgi:hypothetical protein